MGHIPVVELDEDVLERLEVYVAQFAADFGIVTRRHWAEVYLQGLFLDGERKSIQPLSQRVSVPGWHGDTEQALQLFVNQSGWDEQAVLRTYRQLLAESLADAAGVIVIDDTGCAKKGRHSVGVARQYSGTLGKTDNCQIAVSVHYAAPLGDYPLALRLFLPESWTSQPQRMATVHVPAEVQGNRLVAIVGLYLLVGIVVVGGIILLAGPFVRQASELANALPQYVNDLQARAPEVQTTLGQYGIQTDIDQIKTQVAAGIEQGGTDVLRNLVSALAGVGGMILDIVLALVISLYLLVDGPETREQGLAIIPPQHRAEALFLQDNVSRVLGGYLRAQLILALISGVLAGGGTALLGLPYAVVIGLLAGLFQLVPLFGPILSVIPVVLVALFMPFPTVVWVILFFLVIQQVENNVLVPRISGNAVGLHPLGAMFALLAGLQLAGLLGGLFAVPLAGVLWVLLGAGYRNVVAEPSDPRRRFFPVPGFRRPAQRHAPSA